MQKKSTVSAEGENNHLLDSLRDEYDRSLYSPFDESEQEKLKKQYIVLTLGDCRFGIETVECRQVFRLPEIVPLPQVPPHILGIINVRGRVVSVTSLALLIGLPLSPLTKSSRLIIIEHDGISTAIVADSVHNIVEYSEKDRYEVSKTSTGADFAVAEVFNNNQLLLLLSAEKILKADSMVLNWRG